MVKMRRLAFNAHELLMGRAVEDRLLSMVFAFQNRNLVRQLDLKLKDVLDCHIVFHLFGRVAGNAVSCFISGLEFLDAAEHAHFMVAFELDWKCGNIHDTHRLLAAFAF
jgi:hypothetical protein